MLLFTIVEIVNKLLGLYVTGYLARILPPTTLGHYLTGLVMLGYALELAFFGAQNRHNAEYALHRAEYLGSRRFAARKTLTTIAVGISAVFLFISTRNIGLQTLPLMLVLPYALVAFEFIGYGEGRTRVLVLARFVSQIVAVGWVTLIAHGVVATTHVYWGQFLQTWSSTALIVIAMVSLGRLRREHVFVGVTRFPVRRDELATAVTDQSRAFVLRLAVMAAVTSELLILNVVGNHLSAELATCLRIVQIVLPFIVFYIDSSVRSVSDAGFLRYTVLVALGTLALVIGAPVLVRLLYGRAYMPVVAYITAFAPAFVIEALCQFQLMAALKAGTEKRLIKRLVFATLLSSIALALILVTGGTLRDVALLYTVKALVVVMLLPTEETRAKWLAAGVVIASAALNLVFYETGYYDAIARILA